MTNGKRSGAYALAVLADPTRRVVFEQLAKEPSAVGELAQKLPVSRPAVSQHLRALKDVGLVTESQAGTRRIYRLDPRGIAAMRQWLDDLWEQSLQNFAALADAEAEERTS